METGDAVRLRRPLGRLPRVEAEMVVISAGGDEEDVAGRPPPRHIAGLEDDVEAEDADVEVADAVDVRRPQVDVADPDVRVDRALGVDGRLDGSLRAAHAPQHG